MPVQYVLQATSLEKLQEVLAHVHDRRSSESPVFQMADVKVLKKFWCLCVNLHDGSCGTSFSYVLLRLTW